MELNKALEKVRLEFNENINSHIFLVETNNTQKCSLEIKKLIKCLIDENSKIVASQIDEESYLELIIVRPDGKTIKKEQIYTLQERLRTKPVLSDKIFYIIEEADLMNDTSSNKLLKTIEEPNENIIGFLITENIDVLLPTIKSRCEIIVLKFEETVSSELENAEVESVVIELIKYIETENLLEYNIFKTDNKTIKENGKQIVNKIKQYYNKALALTNNKDYNIETIELIKKRNNFNQLIRKSTYLNKNLNKLVFNMNTDLLLEKIFIELKDVKNDANSGDKI